MEAKIVRIGNSKGLRLGKTILEKYNIKDKVELVLEDDCILIRAIVEPRKNWTEQLTQMHVLGDDSLMIEDVFDEEEFEEWK